jgi:hypothetical protein
VCPYVNYNLFKPGLGFLHLAHVVASVAVEKINNASLELYDETRKDIMSSHFFLRRSLSLLIPIAIPLTIYLYLYPIFHGCGFPSPTPGFDTLKKHLGHEHGATFRLLALGDPQLEGDTSLPDSGEIIFPALKKLREIITNPESLFERAIEGAPFLSDFLTVDIPRTFQIYRKQLDLVGNDYYLAHIYRTIHWWTKPTHVTVLGDLLGSQWVSDKEFERRGSRFWKRVFRGGQKIEEDIMRDTSTESLNQETWSRSIINIVGNHDVGYAGDMTAARIARFEKTFGLVNWEKRFRLENEGPELRIIVLNTLNMDGPAIDANLQTSTYSFINSAILESKPVEDRSIGTILLTHVPLHKHAGICIDGPRTIYGVGGIKEQNHLSPAAGLGILEGVFGMSADPDAPAGGVGRSGIILNGHDHEGCDTYHFLDQENWAVQRWRDANSSTPGVREVTVRSMMGEFGGNAGLLSAWFDGQDWRFEYSTCQLGVQHYWWAIHILDIICLLGISALPLAEALQTSRPSKEGFDQQHTASSKKHHRAQGKSIRKRR